MAVAKRTRFEVFKRDKFTCQYCGRRPPDVMLEVDHILPRVEGGGDGIENLTTACAPCNRGKAGIPLDDVAPAIAELEMLASVQEMLERKYQLKRQSVAAEAARSAEKQAIEQVQGWWEAAFLDDGIRGEFQYNSIRMFLRKLLTLEDLSDAITLSEGLLERKPWYVDHPYHVWKYFCGVCWGMIKQKREAGDVEEQS